MKSFEPGKYARPLRLAIVIALLALAGMVGWLQLRRSDGLVQRMEAQQTRNVYVPACRGRLLDCDGNVLNCSVPVYSIAIMPDMTRDPRDTRARSLEKLSGAIAAVASALGPQFFDTMPKPDALQKHLREQPAMPLVLWRDVDVDTRAKWLSIRDEHPATELQLSWRRVYERPLLARQWRGLVGKRTVSSDDNGRYWNSSSYELYGIGGMEKALERLLAGQGGAEVIRTDVLSYRQEVVGSRPADNGDDCRMTMVSAAQDVAEAAFAAGRLNGAAVAVDVRDGSVLVLASAYAGTPRGSDDEAAGLNRAVAGRYPPGSVLKPLLALYAMDAGLAGPMSPIVDCPGYYQLPDSRRLGCSHIHGTVTMQSAIAQSCNTYFCVLAQRLEESHFDDFASLFGFGEVTGGVCGMRENAGVAFSPSWVHESRQEMRTWLPGDAAHASIGQGSWAVTPLQMALAGVFAVNGKLFCPRYFVDDDVVVRKFRQWQETAHRTVLDGMRDCVISGTGKALSLPGVQVIGKTGTAEVGGGRRPHAWVMAAAPYAEPRYLVVVVVENGGAGGKAAAPIARDILDELLKHEEG